MKNGKRSWSWVVAGIIAIAVAALAAPNGFGATLEPFVAGTAVDGTTVHVLVVNPNTTPVQATVKVVVACGANLLVLRDEVQLVAASSGTVELKTAVPADSVVSAIIQDGPDPY